MVQLATLSALLSSIETSFVRSRAREPVPFRDAVGFGGGDDIGGRGGGGATPILRILPGVST